MRRWRARSRRARRRRWSTSAAGWIRGARSRPASRCGACSGFAATVDVAAKAADLVLGAGGFDLIALDLGDERPRLPTAGWIRFKHGAEKQGTTLLVAAPARAAGSCAAAVVELAPGAPRFVADGGAAVRRAADKGGEGAGRARARAAESEEARCASLAFSCRS